MRSAVRALGLAVLVAFVIATAAVTMRPAPPVTSPAPPHSAAEVTRAGP